MSAMHLNAVPESIDTDAACGIVIAPPPCGDPLVLWVDDGTTEAPPGSTICTIDDATRWTSDGPPSWLHDRLIDGVLVQCDTAAPASTRRAARALRERLSVRDLSGMRALAESWGNPTVIDALGHVHSDHAPTFADLARALARNPDPASARMARLCWALEHL